ncbi:MAG TPA: FecR family protein [Oligoflexus sp.]|uniref:FecR family protein n=1 Tax=Oligoflexus sp. TaxID=1971216 RepID=UPI002D52BB9C|nr:FecR family protein [Oligoflexus sp.]HYX35898.1 FecR family protein [Oligoflexus sp.]
MKSRQKLGILTIFFSLPAWGAAGDHTAKITRFFGKAQILSQPSDKKAGQPPHALFEGKYYHVEPARLGSEIQLGSIIQTSDKTMVRLVYPNGDQIMVSPSSSYKVSLETKDGKDKPISELIYGKFRAVISKDGPRSKSEVRTRTMVMGIRGTDFHVAAFSDQGGSVVSVLRGAVAVTPQVAKSGEQPQTIEVKTGFSASVPPQNTVPMKVAATDKLDLRAIQDSVNFQKNQPNEAAPDPETQKTIALLEATAVASTKKDIQTGDPDLYKRIEAAEAAGKAIDNLEVLQAVTLEKALVRAPEPSAEKIEALEKAGVLKKPAAPPRKPSSQELDELEGGIYDKYFKR